MRKSTPMVWFHWEEKDWWMNRMLIAVLPTPVEKPSMSVSIGQPLLVELMQCCSHTYPRFPRGGT
jgi:hypothetical protein